eukprot:4595267-Prymnesium_polylepis.1
MDPAPPHSVLLKQLGLRTAERNKIEGLRSERAASHTASGLTEEQRSISTAVARLAADPPPSVGTFQRRTAVCLLRPFPLGLRCVLRQEYEPSARLARRGAIYLYAVRDRTKDTRHASIWRCVLPAESWA